MRPPVARPGSRGSSSPPPRRPHPEQGEYGPSSRRAHRERRTRRSTRARRPRHSERHHLASESSSHNARTDRQAGSTQTSSSSARTPWRIDVSLRARTVSLLRDGRVLDTWSAVIGKPSTPTPPGLYAIYERVRQPSPNDFLGTWALLLSGVLARSPRLRRRPRPGRDPRPRGSQPARPTRQPHDRTVASESTTAPSTSSRPTQPKAHQSKSPNLDQRVLPTNAHDNHTPTSPQSQRSPDVSRTKRTSPPDPRSARHCESAERTQISPLERTGTERVVADLATALITPLRSRAGGDRPEARALGFVPGNESGSPSQSWILCYERWLTGFERQLATSSAISVRQLLGSSVSPGPIRYCSIFTDSVLFKLGSSVAHASPRSSAHVSRSRCAVVRSRPAH